MGLDGGTSRGAGVKMNGSGAKMRDRLRHAAVSALGVAAAAAMTGAWIFTLRYENASGIRFAVYAILPVGVLAASIARHYRRRSPYLLNFGISFAAGTLLSILLVILAVVMALRSFT